MRLIRNAVKTHWQEDNWRFPVGTERKLRDLSHMSLLVFVIAAVVASILAGVLLSSNFGTGASSTFVVVAILLPLLCGLLAREIWHAKKLETQVRDQAATASLMGNALKSGDNTPAGLLIVSQDLRIRFANQEYLARTLLEHDEVLGWKIQDVLLADGLAERANALLACSDPAASCCLNTLVRAGIDGERPVHITMTRIAPRQGEDRVLVVVEDLLPGCSSRVSEPVEGYVC